MREAFAAHELRVFELRGGQTDSRPADPGPVVQTSFVDQEMQEQLALDRVVTVVDSGHIALHLDDSHQAQRADRVRRVIILNKNLR